MIATDGIVTVVDHTDYNLSLREAAQRLKNKESIIAVEFPDYSQEFLGSVYPEPETLPWQNFYQLEISEIIEAIRSYEKYGTLDTETNKPHTL